MLSGASVSQNIYSVPKVMGELEAIAIISGGIGSTCIFHSDILTVVMHTGKSNS